MVEKDAIRIGIIGAGRIGNIHAQNLATRIPNAEVGAIADIYLEAAEKIGAQFAIPMITKNHQVLLDDASIDAVVICSATATHTQMIQDSAAAGKHIFCEKPIDFDLARIDQALQAVEEANVKLQIGFNRRFDPSFRRVRQMIADGKIGHPHILRITSRDPEPPPLDYVKGSGGIFLDMTIHDFDMARYLIGSEVTHVYTAGAVLVDPKIGELGDLDTALITLHFENGVIGAIDNSRKAVYGYDQRVEVFGSQGLLRAGNETADRHIYSNTEGVHGPLPLYFFLERYTASYVAELQSFVDCVVNDTTPEVTGIDGRIPVLMGLAAKRSYEEKRPVRLEEVDLSN